VAGDQSAGRPQAGDMVEVHYVGTLLDGSKFDSSRDRGDTFKFTLGKGQVIKGWDKGVATMFKGEKAILTCRSDYAYGASGSPPKIPGGATLQFEVELFSWVDSRDMSDEKDGSLVKIVEKKGRGFERPRGEDEVVVRIQYRRAGTDEALHVTEATFALGNGPCHAVNRALEKMDLGEVAVVKAAARHCFGAAGGLNGAVGPDQDLDVRVELLEIHPVDDLGMPGLVKRTVVRKGDSSSYKTAGELGRVRVKYTVRLEDGTVVDASHAETEHAFVSDEAEVPPALDAAVCKMKEGEACVIVAEGTAAAHASLEGKVPEGTRVVFDAEMVGFEAEKGTWEMEDGEKVEWAEARKANGNGWFKRQDFARALKRYKSVVDALDFDSSFPDDLKKRSRAIASACLLNTAACEARRKNWKASLEAANKALTKENTVKGLFRRAQAHFGMGDFDLAEADLKEALLRDPESADLKSELKRVKAAVKAYDDKQRGMFKKMFG